jgi:acetoin:2,6-dichlorophenolindophenol oxidoreductase subunit alpha
VTVATENSVEKLLALYGTMMTIRLFEENAIELFAAGLITGSTHPYIGQEAISVGACAALDPKDIVLATYRGHGAAIAKGSDPKILMAELLTRVTGCCKGSGGSMHLCDKAKGFIGTNAIVAAHIPIAGGTALAAKLRKTKNVVLCFFGDGATCEGEFFETMNMASLWKIPLVFICENNGYAISVSTKLSQSTPDIADRARGFGMPSAIVDGNDVVAVQKATAEAVARARQDQGPTLIECKTVRWERHSAFSSGRYDNPEEAQKWKSVDPIPRFRQVLKANGASLEQISNEEAVAKGIVQNAVKFAKESDLPRPESVYEGVFAGE